MSTLIEVVTLDHNEQELERRCDFATMKEARQWVKDACLNPSYWDRRAESVGWAVENVWTVQLLKNGDCVEDWFPHFKVCSGVVL